MRIIERRLIEQDLSIFNELGREENLGEWNREQYKLWMQLVKQGYVNKNDPNMFGRFGAFFYDFFRKNNKLPTLQDVSKLFV